MNLTTMPEPRFVVPTYDARHRCYFYSKYPPRLADFLCKCDCVIWEIVIIICAMHGGFR